MILAIASWIGFAIAVYLVYRMGYENALHHVDMDVRTRLRQLHETRKHRRNIDSARSAMEFHLEQIQKQQEEGR